VREALLLLGGTPPDATRDHLHAAR
jgi:hypothetical protein